MSDILTQVELRGALCGAIWWPVSAKCGVDLPPIDLQREAARQSGQFCFRDLLLLVQSEHGGDFQSVSFTADTSIIVRRIRHTENGRIIHEREIPLISPLAGDCADLVDAETYS